jgi:hypothetical protein
MKIADLSFSESMSQASKIRGGVNTANDLFLAIENGILTLKLGNTKLLQTAIATSPARVVLSLETSNLHTTSSSSNVNGIEKSLLVITSH